MKDLFTPEQIKMLAAKYDATLHQWDMDRIKVIKDRAQELFDEKNFRGLENGKGPGTYHEFKMLKAEYTFRARNCGLESLKLPLTYNCPH